VVQQTDRRQASAHWAWTLGPEGAPEAGRHLAIAKAPANGRPPRGNLHLIVAVAQAARSAHSRRPASPGPQHGLGWATGSISTCLKPLPRPDSGAATDQLPGNANAVPRPGSGQPGLTDVPGLLRRQRHLTACRAAPETVAEREDGSRRASALPPGLLALQLAAARVGRRLMHDFGTDQLSDRSRPLAIRIERAP